MVAAASGTPKKVTEEFLKEFFNEIASCLENGETVKIKGIGTFKVSRVNSRKSVNVTSGEEIEIPQHVKTVFVPTKELAQAVNLPFEAFDAVEIGNSVTQEMLNQAEKEDEPEQVEAEEIETPAEQTQQIETNNTDEDDADSEPFYYMKINDSGESEEKEKEKEEEKEEEKAITEPDTEPQEQVVEKEAIEEVAPSIDSQEAELHIPESKLSYDLPTRTEEIEETRHGMRGFAIGFASAIAVLVVATMIFIFLFPGVVTSIVSTDNEKNAIVESIQSDAANAIDDVDADADTAMQPSESTEKTELTPTTPVSDAVADEIKSQTDTITKTRYLTTMARDHYGNYNLWPYIYKENEKILGHPDRIRPGTEVVIPDLKKYGVDANNPEDIKKAKRMGVEIYERYKK